MADKLPWWLYLSAFLVVFNLVGFEFTFNGTRNSQLKRKLIETVINANRDINAGNNILESSDAYDITSTSEQNEKHTNIVAAEHQQELRKAEEEEGNLNVVSGEKPKSNSANNVNTAGTSTPQENDRDHSRSKVKAIITNSLDKILKNPQISRNTAATSSNQVLLSNDDDNHAPAQATCDCYSASIARLLGCEGSQIRKLANPKKCNCESSKNKEEVATKDPRHLIRERRTWIYMALEIYQTHCAASCEGSQYFNPRTHMAGLFSQVHMKWKEVVFEGLKFRPTHQNRLWIASTGWKYLNAITCPTGKLSCWFKSHNPLCASNEQEAKRLESGMKRFSESDHFKTRYGNITDKKILEATKFAQVKKQLEATNGFFARFLKGNLGKVASAASGVELLFTDIIAVTNRYLFEPTQLLKTEIYRAMTSLGLVPGRFLSVNLRRGLDKVSEGLTIQPKEQVALLIKQLCKKYAVSKVYFLSDDRSMLQWLRNRLSVKNIGGGGGKQEDKLFAKGIDILNIPRKRIELKDKWDEATYLFMNVFVLSMGCHFIGSMTSNLARMIVEIQAAWMAFSEEAPPFTDLDKYTNMEDFKNGWWFCSGNHCDLCQFNAKLSRVCIKRTPCPYCKNPDNTDCPLEGCSEDSVQFMHNDTNFVMRPMW